jgi:hypothetical protein
MRVASVATSSHGRRSGESATQIRISFEARKDSMIVNEQRYIDPVSALDALRTEFTKMQNVVNAARTITLNIRDLVAQLRVADGKGEKYHDLLTSVERETRILSDLI